MLGNLFSSMIENKISYDDFLLASEVINKINLDDLHYFIKNKYNELTLEEGGIYVSTGLMVAVFDVLEHKEAGVISSSLKCHTTSIGKLIQELLQNKI